MNVIGTTHGLRESFKEEITLEIELEKMCGIYQRVERSGRAFVVGDSPCILKEECETE